MNEQEEYAPHQLPKPGSLNPQEVKCRFCKKPIRWGLTTNGNRAPFDADPPPHPNHWISCTRKEKARAAYPKRKA